MEWKREGVKQNSHRNHLWFVAHIQEYSIINRGIWRKYVTN